MPTLLPQHRNRPIPDPFRMASTSPSVALPSVSLNRVPQMASDGLATPKPDRQYEPTAAFLSGAASVTKRFDRKQIVIQKGEAGSALYVVLSGRVKVASLSTDGKEMIFAYLGPGEFFGEMAVLDGTFHTATVTAVEPTVLRIIDRRDFRGAIERNPEAALTLATTLCARLRRASELVEDISFLDVAARLAKTLLHLVEMHGTPTAKGIRIALPLCQQDLANLVSTTRESINKQLRIWQENGLVSIETGTLTILRLSELQKMVQA